MPQELEMWLDSLTIPVMVGTLIRHYCETLDLYCLASAFLLLEIYKKVKSLASVTGISAFRKDSLVSAVVLIVLVICLQKTHDYR